MGGRLGLSVTSVLTCGVRAGAIPWRVAGAWSGVRI